MKSITKAMGLIAVLFTILLAAFAVADNATANESEWAPMKLVCNEYDRSSEKILQNTFVLSQLDKQAVTDGDSNLFAFEFFDDASTYTNIHVKGMAEVEDVHFYFVSENGKYTVSIYLDEMGETTLSIDGANAGDYICR